MPPWLQPTGQRFSFRWLPKNCRPGSSLDQLLKGKDAKIDSFISLQVGQEELVSRLLNRGKTSGRSDDTNEEIIRARLNEYENKTAPVAGYYETQDKLEQIKGEGSIDESSTFYVPGLMPESNFLEF
jgi:adenylate kinase